MPERIIRSELAAMGHDVVRVIVYQSTRGSQHDWSAVGVECRGELPRYACIDADLLCDAPILRAWVNTQWGAVCPT